MSLPAEVLELLTVPITVERFESRDGFGNPVYAEPETVMSVIQVHTRRRGTPTSLADGVPTPIEVYSRIIVDVGDFKPFDKVTLPDGEEPTVITVDTIWDDEGEPFYQQFIVEENRK
jgi:hypothetical protein